jgi:hypothetical protein
MSRLLKRGPQLTIIAVMESYRPRPVIPSKHCTAIAFGRYWLYGKETEPPAAIRLDIFEAAAKLRPVTTLPVADLQTVTTIFPN